MRPGLKRCLLLVAIFLSGCGWFSGPTKVAKDYVYELRDGKYDYVFKLLSTEYVTFQRDSIKTHMKGFY